MNVVTWARTSSSDSLCETDASEAMLARTAGGRRVARNGQPTSACNPNESGRARTEHADDVAALDVRLLDGLLARGLARDDRLLALDDALDEAA